mgnify:CR=1 FL=1
MTTYIIERVNGNTSTNGESGWLVADPEWISVQTVVLDSNFEGPVESGAVVERAGNFPDGRPRFRCVLNQRARHG